MVRHNLVRMMQLKLTLLKIPALRYQSSASFRSDIQVHRTVPDLRAYRNQFSRSSQSVGLVPTMGALHEGHLSLVRLAAAQNPAVFVSIYVNPTQFGVTEDLSTYPATWDSDMKKLEAVDRELASTPGSGRVVAVFAPTTEVMYPSGFPSQEIGGSGSFVTISPLGSVLEGASRPVFFRGVATVCMKLFNIVKAERVYFGQKDVQQTVVIQRMVKDFHVDTNVIIGDTQREVDGLALSSRNIYLGSRRRSVAVVLSQALMKAEEQFLKGKRTRDELLGPAWELLKERHAGQDTLPSEQRARFEADYISLADPESLEEIDAVDDRGAILSGAIKMMPLEDPVSGEDAGMGGGIGTVRLIDNIILRPT
ncbi:pantoate-beta-alanine ligase [Eremomyces bilateralis CBS 781.70]|uniref:Pantoate--beta-alanine ligase n=1 Tax=Eremomyces bilateralis CBS 781.70 TaxID=1392243 RepID=A0A6G1G7U6_9PEZI|nr:pantoate-beta-alanine ligase [Eremomyces bilateralis CBS 781.70]KAF1814147.1 pantoate-beta-alanine ligase [Eremomyces bilateralis CBS 781.70]